MSEFVASRRIGDATVTVVSEGTLRWFPGFSVPDEDRRRAMPDLEADGKIRLGLNLVHIRVGAASIVVDPGCDDPASAWQREFAAKWPGLTRSPGLEAALAEIGVASDSVSHVLITHAHADHLAGVARERNGALAVRFPRARHFIGRRDWEGNPARNDPGSDLAVRVGLVERHRLLDLVAAEREVAPGVAVVPSPGETPGHFIVRVESGGRRFYYLGDLFHHPCEVEHPDWTPPNRDPVTLRASRDRLLAEAASAGAVLVFAHNRFPAWGRVVRAGPGCRWERV